MPPNGLPDVEIRINGVTLPMAAQRDLKRVVVDETVDGASLFTLEFYNWDDVALRCTWSDDKIFAPGGEVEIALGYVGQLAKVLVAEITGMEAAFVTGEAPTMTLQGYDHRHRLFRGRHTRTFLKVTDAEIVRKIASGAGLRAQVADTGLKLDYVLQHNQTDGEFVQARAQRIGYEWFVRDRTLYFRPIQNNGRPALVLTPADLIAFTPRLSILAQAGTVEVRGWDMQKQEPVVGKAATAPETPTMGGSMTGPRAADRAFGKSTEAAITTAALSKADASLVARGHFNQMALSYVEAEGECSGRTDLRVGTVIRIDGAGKTFSGLYYVRGVTHTVTQGGGYRTQFRVQRNAI